MGKKSSSKKRPMNEEEVEQERRSKMRKIKASSTLKMVNPNLTPLFHGEEAVKLYREKFHDRKILDGKYVDFDRLQKMFELEHIDVAQYIANHGWIDFLKLKCSIHDTLLKILFSNLDARTMTSWIGKKKIDLSVDVWCRHFNIPNVTPEEEHFIMTLNKNDLFFRLTGERNLGVMTFIRTNQLHQEPNSRLTAQLIMSVLVPKKGSKEQIKVEEGRLLYALMFDARINLAQMIVDRLRGVAIRKSSPICYPMHLTEIMKRAGVNLTCAGNDARPCKSVFDHHTLKRLGYRLRIGGWEYVGRGKVNREEGQSSPRHEEVGEEGGETQEETTLPTEEESQAPPHPKPHPQTTTQTNLHITSQLANLATKSDLAHFRNFVAEQLQLMQATMISKFDSLETRLHNAEVNVQILLSRSQPQPPPQTPTHDPKGKAPMVSPSPSHHSPSQSQNSTPYHSPIPSQLPLQEPSQPPSQPTTSPQPSQAHPISSSSSSSSSSTSGQFEVVPHPPQAARQSHDSEATQSPSPPKPKEQPSSAPSSSPKSKDVRTSYQRRRKPGSSA